MARNTSNKKQLTEKDKNDFIRILTSYSDVEINQYIHDHGKENKMHAHDGLFVFRWDLLKEDYNKKYNNK